MISRGLLLRRPLRPWTSSSPIFAARCLHNLSPSGRPVLLPNLKPTVTPPGRRNGRAWETTTTGDKQSGHIAASQNEGILFIDSKLRHPPYRGSTQSLIFLQTYSPSSSAPCFGDHGRATATSPTFSGSSTTPR
ncbi:hypothetical protein CONLIGDRAFT_634044 [Coniochaeta ligniaria NRRL 30616]|uniref:Uncharacterized protein n=1 Tax=Coniochaeta ligniaria NRRL 30616 TaxID=1408157 RepID=A0A1J7JJ83_9PEZI|nr:hypothetical protein CONLIGDRAFT_634044 [Coniochaeta ligniaria NRRL 30616]